MELGIFAKTFERPTIDQVFAATAALGLGFVQFNMACAGLPSLPDNVPDAAIEAIEHAAGRHEIEIAALSGTFNMIHPDASVRRAGLVRLGVLAAAAKRLAIPVITLCTGTRDPNDQWAWHQDNCGAEAWRDLVATLGGALVIAERTGVVLAFEPESANVVDSARKGRALLAEMGSANLKAVIDPANLLEECSAAASRRAIDNSLDLLGPDIVLAHAKDRGPDGRPLAPGRGVIDFGHYVAGLARIGFAGQLIMHGFGERDAAAAARHLRRALAVV